MSFSFEIKCPACQAGIQIDETFIGTRYPCKKCKTNFQVPATSILPGMQLDDYVIEKRLGGSTRSDIFLVRSLSRNQNSILKVFSPFITIHKESARDFLVLSNHRIFMETPCLVMPEAIGIIRSFPYIAMPWVHGEDLAQRFRRIGVFSETQLIDIALKSARILSRVWTTIHQVHGRIKPSNLITTEFEDIVILDFGMHRILECDPQVSPKIMNIDFEAFCAPEVLQHGIKAESIHSDIYSLGASLYFLATGVKPIHPSTLQAIMKESKEEETEEFSIPRVNELNPNLSGDFGCILERCLLEKSLRYDSWERFIQVFEEYRATQISTQVLRVGSASERLQQVKEKQDQQTLPPSPSRRRRLLSPPKISSHHQEDSTLPNWIVPLIVLAFLAMIIIPGTLYHFWFTPSSPSDNKTIPSQNEQIYLSWQSKLESIYQQALNAYNETPRNYQKSKQLFLKLQQEATQSPSETLRSHYTQLAKLYLKQLDASSHSSPTPDTK